MVSTCEKEMEKKMEIIYVKGGHEIDLFAAVKDTNHMYKGHVTNIYKFMIKTNEF
jgi:hypothetical protein